MFTTTVEIPRYPFTISHSRRGLLLGSCFAGEIGAKMAAAKLPVRVNPHGVLFNPASIGRAYNDIITERIYTTEELVENRGVWHSMQHHGSFSAATPDEVLSNINHITQTRYDYIIVTLGTAWVYEYRGEIVANCHKLPSTEFVRRRLSVSECVEALSGIARSGVDVIVTVSPVRHVKDGLAENSLSKAILRVAAAELAAQFDNVHYFPAFEIVTDELRDYRYYADDMVHPSRVAVDYVWKRFCEALFTTETRRLIAEIAKLNAALAHRPLHPESAEYAVFRAATETAIRNLEGEFGLDFGLK